VAEALFSQSAHVSVHPCVCASRANISKLCWIFVDGIWPNFHH